MTRPRLSSPELHRACIVYEIGKVPRAIGKRQTAHGQRRTASGGRRAANGATPNGKGRTVNGKGQNGWRKRTNGRRQTADGKLHFAHCKLQNGVHTTKTANTAKLARTATTAKDQRTANGQRRFDKSVSVSLCRCPSVFMNIVAICQVNIQHTHTRGAESLEQCRCQWSLEFDDWARSTKCRRSSQKGIFFTSKS